MKTTISTIALVALAGVASAQTASISYDFGGADSGALDENTTYTVVVSIAFEGGQDNLLAIDYSTAMASMGSVAGIGNIVVDGDYLAQGGTVTGDATGIEVNVLGPTNLFVPAAGSPQDLFSFELTTGSAGEITVTHGDELITTFNAQFATSDHTIVDSDTTWTVVPTPGALAVAGLGGLVAARRRRA